MESLEDPIATFRVTQDALVLAWIASGVERQLVEQWMAEQRRARPDIDLRLIQLPHGGPPSASLLDLVADDLRRSRDRLVVPVRMFWSRDESASNWRALGTLLSGRDPYRPSPRRQARIVRSDPSRARIVEAEPATVTELDRRWRDTTSAGADRDFAGFVIRRARLALERAEYRLLGPEYKSPRLVKPELLASLRFQEGVRRIPGATLTEAGGILDEMATGWSRWSVDFVPWLGRMIFRRGFERDLDYDDADVSAMSEAFAVYPAVLLFSHRSNLDALVLAVAMRDNHLPRAHLFGGINMAFGVLGPIMRRSGVIFIRRNIGDNQLYKYVLKQYVSYLVEKRFNLTWSIEGGRSRTGHMLPPRLGLLSYVVDSYAESRSEDILLQPVSISFDQLHETAEYAAYARGADKAPEGMRWFVDFIRAQGQRHYGKIYVRFPAAVSMRAHLGTPQQLRDAEPAARRLALQKMAFEVGSRIQHATPISATALICAVLLADRGRARTLEEIHAAMQDWLDYVERRDAPVTESAHRLRAVQGVGSALDSVSGGHPVTRVDGGWTPVWVITADREHEAAFYRNTISHVFLERAITELALVHAARSGGDRLAAFWSQSAQLRDLLKFDFYFVNTSTYREHICEELAHLGDWEAAISAGEAGVVDLLRGKGPITAPTFLRSFFEAYSIVADVLGASAGAPPERDVIKQALGIGRQYLAQGRIRSSESVSTLLFGTAMKIAGDRGLLVGNERGRADLRDRVTGVLRDLDRLATPSTVSVAM